MRTAAILFVSLAVLFASAQESVPEDDLFSLDDDLSEARATLTSMQEAGKGEAECRRLVQDTKNEITTNVRNEQTILDGLDKGHECSLLKKEADDEKVEQKRTEDAVTTATTNLETAKKADVVFGSRVFSSLKKGDCSWIFSSTAYTTAKAKYNAAVKAKQEAKGAAALAVIATKKAVDEAKRKTKTCLCTTKFQHDAANKNSHRNDAANEKAWNMAHRLECVLDGKTTCSFTGCPKTNAPTVAPEVTSANCEATIQPVNEKKEPTDPCKKYQAEHKANKEIADALAKAKVDFGGGSTTITDEGKKTLDGVAGILTKYPWMAMEVRGHSDASAGPRCDELTKGRANSSMKYLKLKGAANKMTVLKGSCGKIRAITVRPISVFNAGAKPAGCKVE